MNGKNKSGFFFFFWLGHELGPISKRSPVRAGSGPGKKPGTLNGAGPSHGSCPAGWVRVWKNPARTRPVAIPMTILVMFVIGFVEGFCVGASGWLALCYKVG